jgi:hypothetical protein
MKTWRLLINVFFVAIAVAGVIWQESNLGTATVWGAVGIATVASLGAALLGEFIGIIVGKDDFCKKSYFISVAVGVVFALVLSLIVL